MIFHIIQPGLHQARVADQDIRPLADTRRYPLLATVCSHCARLEHCHPETLTFQNGSQPRADVPAFRVGDKHQDAPTALALPPHQVHQCLLLRVQHVVRQGRCVGDDLTIPRVEDGFTTRDGVGIRQERLEVGGQEALGAFLEGGRHRLPQLSRELAVGARLGELTCGVPLIQLEQRDTLGVRRQVLRHVGQAQEDGVADQVKEHHGRDAGLLDNAGVVAATFGEAAIVGVAVGVLLCDALDDAVPANPARLVVVAELAAHGRAEPPQQVEQRRRIAAENRATQSQRSGAGVSQSAGGETLG